MPQCAFIPSCASLRSDYGACVDVSVIVVLGQSAFLLSISHCKRCAGLESRLDGKFVPKISDALAKKTLIAHPVLRLFFSESTHFSDLRAISVKRTDKGKN